MQSRLTVQNATWSLAGTLSLVLLFLASEAQAASFDLEPKSGKVGSVVKIKGDTLDSFVVVMMGGTRVRSRFRKKDGSLEFRVPYNYGNGEIQLKSFQNLWEVGTFEVIPPELTSFYPREAAPGTKVWLNGRGFLRGDRIWLNDKLLKVILSTANRLRVQLPVEMEPGPANFVLKRSKFTEVRCDKKFEVLLPPPVVSEFEPQLVYAGDTVTLQVENFMPTSRVYFGGTQLEIVESGAGWVKVVISKKVRFEKHLWVRGRNGNGRSKNKLNVGKKLVRSKAGMAAKSAANGTKHAIISQAMYGRRPGLSSVLDPYGTKRRQLRSLSTAGGRKEAVSNYLNRKSGGRLDQYSSLTTKEARERALQEYASKRFGRKFDKLQELKTPAGRARALQQAVAKKFMAGGAVPSRFKRSPRLEREGSKGKLRRPGRYEVTVIPDSVSPGDEVRIETEKLSHRTKVWYGSVPVKVVKRDETGIVILAPDNTRVDDYIWLKNRVGSKWRSAGKLSIVRPKRGSDGELEPATASAPPESALAQAADMPGPSIGSIQPEVVTWEGHIVITGSNFISDSKVDYGGEPLEIIDIQEDSIRVAVKKDTKMDSYLTVSGPNGQARYSKKIVIERRPEIISFSPMSASVGAEVVIVGKDFIESHHKIRIGNAPVKIKKFSKNRLTIIVPSGINEGKIEIFRPNEQLVARSKNSLVVETEATPD